MQLRLWTVFLAMGIVLGFFILAQWLTPVATVYSGTAAVIETPWQATPSVESTSSWTMTVVGDIMLDRYVRTTIQQRGANFPFEHIRPELVGDIVLGNLEGPMTDRASVATDTHLVFTFDPRMAATLKDVGFTHLSLANNHTLNFGQAGLDNTRRVLAANDLNYFGDPRNRSGYTLSSTQLKQVITFIGYHGLTNGLETIIDEVRSAKDRGDYIVVMPHWGSEYQLGISSRAQQQARQLIEAGADLILGAHPHVVEPFEIYQGKFIAYSLGNFLFDQYFSEDTLQGLLLHLTFNPTTIDLKLMPLRTIAGQIHLLDEAARQPMLNRLAKDSLVDEQLREAIRTGSLTLPR